MGTVILRKNFLLPTRKADRWTTTAAGRSRRTYDKELTPYQRVIDSGILTPGQAEELTAVRDELNPAAITRDILNIQTQLIRSATLKTQARQAAA